MIAYKNYCNRRTDRKGQEPDDIPCCPWRMPIIGPILFSLFIFSPFILPSSEPDRSPEFASDSITEEPMLPTKGPSPIFEIPNDEKHVSLPE